MVAHDELSFGTLSTGERIAVALVLDRYDLLQDAWGTMLEAVHRLGPDWKPGGAACPTAWLAGGSLTHHSVVP